MVQFPPRSENVLLKASNCPPESSSSHVDCFGNEVGMMPRIEADDANVHIRVEEEEGPQRNFFEDILPEWAFWTLKEGLCQGSSWLENGTTRAIRPDHTQKDHL
ncbi:hypothetical protein ARMGADRAFT_1087089 [Armillaria gallica]|uniref:Uncharacterized protein n=1 Tax=Armillaria gallica TaxID=47427 RepID=A0A2H3D4V1_ARMGA|nr:hypothetical protein ARMGADRAFT_1087089 [Armillaria gallica]